jgi:hypothetical protein
MCFICNDGLAFGAHRIAHTDASRRRQERPRLQEWRFLKEGEGALRSGPNCFMALEDRRCDGCWWYKLVNVQNDLIGQTDVHTAYPEELVGNRG